MQAVIKEMPKRWLEERRASDASRWDEMWEGVLHMSPQPTGAHQDLVLELAILLRERWAKRIGGKVAIERNVTPRANEQDWTNNFRSPDIVLLSADRLHFDKDVYVVGPPLVCVEVRSPNDESYEKLPFYAGLGVPEVWIIDRDTKKPEVFVLSGSEYKSRSPESDGWVRSDVAALRMKSADAKLLVVFDGDAQAAVVPE